LGVRLWIKLHFDLVDEMKLRTIADVERSNLGEGAKDQLRRSFTARPKQSKYRNKKIVVDGMTFDSTKEGRVYGQLKLMQASGEILGFARQVTYRIEFRGQLICKYVADFVVNRNGILEVWDVKSDYTRKLPVYKLKKKLMKIINGIEIVEK
jgi:hypothetical protein